jgi:hypothetical protein
MTRVIDTGFDSLRALAHGATSAGDSFAASSQHGDTRPSRAANIFEFFTIQVEKSSGNMRRVSGLGTYLPVWRSKDRKYSPTSGLCSGTPCDPSTLTTSRSASSRGPRSLACEMSTCSEKHWRKEEKQPTNLVFHYGQQSAGLAPAHTHGPLIRRARQHKLAHSHRAGKGRRHRTRQHYGGTVNAVEPWTNSNEYEEQSM